MKKKTYKNVLKAGKMIQKKGYDKQESLEMAVKLFDQLEEINNGMSIEFLIDKIAIKEEWIADQKKYGYFFQDGIKTDLQSLSKEECYLEGMERAVEVICTY